MFDNIGGKIKMVAKVMTALEMIASIIVGIVLISDEYMVDIGFAVLFGGCLFSWISSFFIYGFGELIDKATEIAQNSKVTADVALLNLEQDGSFVGGSATNAPSPTYSDVALLDLEQAGSFVGGSATNAPSQTYSKDVLSRIPKMNGWYCSECGTKNRDNRTVCWQCGKAKQ